MSDLADTEFRRVTSPKFGRVAQVLVGKDGDGDVSESTGLLVEDLRISFEVQKTIYRTPNHAVIRVFNLNQTHENQVKTEFNDIILKAGYRANNSVVEVFRGNIRFAHFYRDGLDRVGEINAGDGDKDFLRAIVQFSLGAKHTDEQVIAKLVEAYQSTGKGHIHGKFLRRERIRGKAYFGNPRDILDQIARENNAHWSIQDGKLTMVPADSTLPTEAIEVSSDTGLLSTPEVNDKGITIKVMLDPRIVPGGKLWLKNNEVRQKRLAAEQTGQKCKAKGPNPPVRLDPDGVYKVFAVKHVGDTRGPDWYSECRCVGLDQPIPSTKKMPVSSSPDGDVL